MKKEVKKPEPKKAAKKEEAKKPEGKKLDKFTLIAGGICLAVIGVAVALMLL